MSYRTAAEMSEEAKMMTKAEIDASVTKTIAKCVAAGFILGLGMPMAVSSMWASSCDTKAKQTESSASIERAKHEADAAMFSYMRKKEEK